MHDRDMDIDMEVDSNNYDKKVTETKFRWERRKTI